MAVDGRRLLFLVGVCLLLASGILSLAVLERHNRHVAYATELYERMVSAGMAADPPRYSLHDVVFRVSSTRVPAQVGIVCAIGGLASLVMSGGWGLLAESHGCCPRSET